jgi:signal transduction histidine kinase
MTSLAAGVTPAWLRRPRPTARLRLALYYSGLFVLSAACLLAIPYVLVRNTSTGSVTSTYDAADHTYTYTYVGPDGVTNLTQGPARHVQGSSTIVNRFSGQQSRAVAEQLRALAVNQHNSELHQLLLYSAIALAVMAAVSVLLGWIVAGRVLRPVQAINATARRISATNLHQRLALDGPDDEFKELGTTLNDLLERLDTSFESQRRFVANASHELRTPLTLERTLLQVALADPDTSLDTFRCIAEKLLTSGAHQEQLIDALLTLASSERGLDSQKTFDLAEITQRTLTQDALDRARRLGLRVHTKISRTPTVGDPQLVQRLVSNLLDNAIHHNHDGGQITVTTGRRAGRSFLSVTNTGRVIPEAEIGRLLEPFQQLGRQRTGHRDGHGLGLAIVSAIATAHHADLIVRSLPDGGLDIEVLFLPMADRSPHNLNGSPVASANGRQPPQPAPQLRKLKYFPLKKSM